MKKLLLVILLASLIFMYGSQFSFATETKEFKGTASINFLNDGAEFEIHWYVDKEKNINVTSFTDNKNEAVIIVEGKHTTDFPTIKASYDEEQMLVAFEKATIILDKDNKIVSIENRGFMEFDFVETEN